jgi:hypothetical protein
MSTNNSWNNAISAAKSAITLNSATNTISIGSDASANTINIATGAAAKAVTFGSTTSTSALTLNSGTGGIKALGVSGVSVSNKNYMSINTSTGALGSDSGPTMGQMILISTQTASTSANLNFTSGITNSYGAYFVSISAINPASLVTLQMLFSTDNGSTYLNSTYTCGYDTTSWNSATWSNVNSTSAPPLIVSTSGGTNGYLNGYFYIFNLASSNTTTYNGRFYGGNSQYVTFGACTTTNINAIRFQMSSGNITSGSISLYGILNS